jgi:hypothetical protein
MRDALKEKLEASAARNQRSLSEELEHRLEMGEMIETMGVGFGRPELFCTMHLIAHAILAVERQTGKILGRGQGNATAVPLRHRVHGRQPRATARGAPDDRGE